ncbi:MAG: isoleucine--tRNA ligase [Pseudomonadota bacterium]
MTDTTTEDVRDYSATLNLPQTDFPMRAGLPKKEPEIVARWQKDDLYHQLREDAAGRPKYVLHDGPPYANGNLHIGHALNKILKDVITRSFQMRGYDSNYVPGWDCHGLPIEWKIEEQYRAKGKNKDEVPINEFRQECRDFASHWVGVQTEEFLRLGVIGDFKTPYLTMNYAAEGIIANELMKFAASGQLYRGSKPIMWSVVERTALAEAEIEYETYESDTIWAKFPVLNNKSLEGASVVIWTTTPWTIPGNRAVCFSPNIAYGLYEVETAENDFGPQPGDRVIFADKLAEECAAKAKVTFKRLSTVSAKEMEGGTLAHPLRDAGLDGYQFDVPLLAGDHVTDDAGTGFVHTAPGHGADDFEAWMDAARDLEARGIDTTIPFTVDDAGYYTDDAPGFGPTGNDKPARVIDDKGKKGDANQRVITALISANNLFARGRVKHDYPHSWRSKKPIIFRNTPQWFVYMDKDGVVGDGSQSNMGTLRQTALAAIDETRFVPERGQNRLRGMIEDRPDWVLSRQRAWGVPISVFRHEETGQIIPGPDFDKSETLMARVKEIFTAEGADAWYAEGAKERFLDGIVDDPAPWQKVDDILDVWFDSGSTHAFCLEQRPDLKWPADVYLEGSDQHRGWFHSSLLESSGTRGRAPYDTVITHGFTMAEDGRKMSKSLGNQTLPQDVIKQSGADILRLWVCSVDYREDQRIGKEILKTAIDSYRKLRNTLRWMLGTLAHDKGEAVALADMPELERLMLHRLHELNAVVQDGYDNFDFKKVFSTLTNFMNMELSAFYFDVRKDALYCDAPSSVRRKAALQVVSKLFDCMTLWMAPMLCFTMEEAWASRYPDNRSVHREQFPTIPDEWQNEALAARWQKVRQVRRVVLGALEQARRLEKDDPNHIGASLEAAPVVHISNAELLAAVNGLDMAEICITSAISIEEGQGPEDAFRLPEVAGVAVVNQRAKGKKCARSWRILPEVGTDPDYPDISLRDAAAMRELEG